MPTSDVPCPSYHLPISTANPDRFEWFGSPNNFFMLSQNTPLSLTSRFQEYALTSGSKYCRFSSNLFLTAIISLAQGCPRNCRYLLYIEAIVKKTIRLLVIITNISFVLYELPTGGAREHSTWPPPENGNKHRAELRSPYLTSTTMFKTAATKIAHNSTLPALAGNQDLRPLQDLIAAEKTVLISYVHVSSNYGI
jgi:hypothetical protein